MPIQERYELKNKIKKNQKEIRKQTIQNYSIILLGLSEEYKITL